MKTELCHTSGAVEIFFIAETQMEEFVLGCIVSYLLNALNGKQYCGAITILPTYSPELKNCVKLLVLINKTPPKEGKWGQ